MDECEEMNRMEDEQKDANGCKRQAYKKRESVEKRRGEESHTECEEHSFVLHSHNYILYCILVVSLSSGNA